MDRIDNIITEVIEQMQKGLVESINYRIKIHIGTSSPFEEITPVLNIKNKELLYSKIKEYISLYSKILKFEEDYIKKIVSLLFANMSIDDFNDPINYVKRAIDFKKEQVLYSRITNPISSLENSIVYIQINNYNVETPYCFQSILTNAIDSYLLPTISYGISNDTCYVYAIQDYNKHEKTTYHEQIKRKLYKLNDKVMEYETQEYKDYKNGCNYYPENISDVSPAAVLSLTLFLNEIEKHGIHKVEVVSYLPVRYENKIKIIASKTLKYAKENDLNKEDTRKLYIKYINEQIRNQNNMTQKFIRTFYRVSHHFKNVKITSLPMELDDKLHVSLSEFEYTDNELLNEVIIACKNNLSK